MAGSFRATIFKKISDLQETIIPNLTLRKIALVTTVIWLLVSVLFFKFWIVPQKGKVAELSTKAESSESNLKTINGELSSIARSVTHLLKEKETDLELVNKYIPYSSAQIMEKLLIPLKDYNLNLVTASFGDPVLDEVTKFDTSNIQLTVSGEYWMLLEYLYMVREIDVLSKLNQVTLTKITEGEPLTLNLNMLVYLF